MMLFGVYLSTCYIAILGMETVERNEISDLIFCIFENFSFRGMIF